MADPHPNPFQIPPWILTLDGEMLDVGDGREADLATLDMDRDWGLDADK